MIQKKILFISKVTKLEFLKEKYNYPSVKCLINNYKKEKLYKSLIHEHNEHFKTIDHLKTRFPHSDFISIKNLSVQITKGYDIIVSIGGDETYKRVLHHSCLDKKFLSIRSCKKSEGVLSSYSFSQIDQLKDDLKNDRIKIKSLNSMDIEIKDELKNKIIKKHWSMDTIYIGNQLSTYISKYFISDGIQIEKQKSSGILIVIGSGYKGWYRSANGKYFKSCKENGIQYIVREIYYGKEKKDFQIRNGFINEGFLEIKSLMHKKGIINVDSALEYEFLRGKSIKVYPNKDRKINIIYPLD